jgi:NADH:ubiquinone oxidoreductase subunit 5 (subunit L)/multisubunit Na+/H+ antiporter MnhA subunit
MKQESIQLVLNYLDKIAAKLGTTAEQVWPWLIRQQYVEAIYPFIIFIILFIPFFFVMRFPIHHWNPDEGYNICNSSHEPPWIFLCVALGFIVLGSFAGFIIELGDLFNPEYHAFMKILSLAR